jgi:hypothetical protein
LLLFLPPSADRKSVVIQAVSLESPCFLATTDRLYLTDNIPFSIGEGVTSRSSENISVNPNFFPRINSIYGIPSIGNREPYKTSIRVVEVEFCT